jgi:hypothetical protein
MNTLYMFFFASTFREDLPVGLALALVPFLLGWLFSYIFHGVNGLKESNAKLNAENTNLTDKVHKLDSELTDTRVKLTQAEALSEQLSEQIKKLKNEVLILTNDLFKATEKKEKGKKE